MFFRNSSNVAYLVSAFFFLLAILSWTGCGGTSQSSSSTPSATNNPPAIGSQPGGNSGGSSGSGGGSTGGSGGSAGSGSGSGGATSGGAYMATMFLMADGSAAPRGTVNVNTQSDNGSGTLQISGSHPTTSYDLQFCSGGQPATSCTGITTYSTDASGSANVMFQVPPGAPGTFGYHVGSFYVFNNGNPIYTSGADSQAIGTSFRGAFLPEFPQNPPPGGGSVSASGQSLHVTLSGMPASMSYEVLLCSPTSAGLRCNSFGTNTVDVDAQGNGAKDFPLPSETFVGFVQVQNHLNQVYVSGFRVP